MMTNEKYLGMVKDFLTGISLERNKSIAFGYIALFGNIAVIVLKIVCEWSPKWLVLGCIGVILSVVMLSYFHRNRASDRLVAHGIKLICLFLIFLELSEVIASQAGFGLCSWPMPIGLLFIIVGSFAFKIKRISNELQREDACKKNQINLQNVGLLALGSIVYIGTAILRLLFSGETLEIKAIFISICYGALLIYGMTVVATCFYFEFLARKNNLKKELGEIVELIDSKKEPKLRIWER